MVLRSKIIRFSEKDELFPTTVTTHRGLITWATRLLLTFASFGALWGTVHIYTGSFTESFGGKLNAQVFKGLCPQADQLIPVKNSDLYEEFGSLIDTHSYKQRAIDWLAGAVKIPTESYDEMGEIGEDPRWEAFARLHTYLHEGFPLM